MVGGKPFFSVVWEMKSSTSFCLLVNSLISPPLKKV
jgi:hypothetical protein